MESEVNDIRWMQRCLELASKGKNGVLQNPMVGSVIVYNNTIIGEGFHHEYGKAHAEVKAIEHVKDKSLLPQATLYVSLEPCAHFGKTPPCSDLIVKHNIKRVVIATIDPFSKVSGKGIEKLKNAGIETKVGVLQEEARFLNRQFFVFHKKQRPYIILKWAESSDGFIDILRSKDQKGSFPISHPESAYYNHQWRSDEDAILVGYKTAKVDNPNLTSRKIAGSNPLRIVLDDDLTLPENSNLHNTEAPTWIVNRHKNLVTNNLTYVKINSDSTLLETLSTQLFNANKQSVIIEGGAKTHKHFLDANLWDEIRIIKSSKAIHSGLQANPTNTLRSIYRFNYLNDQVVCILNPDLNL